MFAKLSALLLALPLVFALDIQPLANAIAGSVVEIDWTASTTDPAYFSIELQNAIFNKQYAIANNVQTSLGSIQITLPQVPEGGGYNLVAILINNVNDVLSTSTTFSIGTASSSSSSASSTTSSASSTSSGTTSTASPTSTSPASSLSSSAVISSTPSSTTVAASSTPSSFNSNGAAGFKMPGMVPAAGVLLSAVAGAAMVF